MKRKLFCQVDYEGEKVFGYFQHFFVCLGIYSFKRKRWNYRSRIQNVAEKRNLFNLIIVHLVWQLQSLKPCRGIAPNFSSDLAHSVQAFFHRRRGRSRGYGLVWTRPVQPQAFALFPVNTMISKSCVATKKSCSLGTLS